MRPTITWLLVLVIGSMLVGTAFADCVAMTMPCCAQHRNRTCHDICATPTGNISNATVPQVVDDFQAVAAIRPVVPVPQFHPLQIRYEFAPSSENLLTRIHVLLL
jgi:hypothetical protein